MGAGDGGVQIEGGLVMKHEWIGWTTVLVAVVVIAAGCGCVDSSQSKPAPPKDTPPRPVVPPPPPPVTKKPGPRPLVVKGLGAIKNDDEAGARKAAIDDALRLAVEMRYGVAIKSKRESQRYLLTKDRIVSAAEGCVEKYEVVKEERYRDTYVVTLAVWFREDAPKSPVLHVLQAALIASKVVVNGQEVETPYVNDAVRQALTEAGVRLMPLSTSTEFGTDFEELARAAKEANVDLLIFLRSAAMEKNKIAGLVIAEATCRVQASKPFTGEQFVTKRFSVKGERKASLRDAMASALQKAGKEAGDYVLQRIIKSHEGLAEKRVFLYGVGSRAKVEEIRKELLLDSGIRGAELKVFTEEMAVLLVRFDLRVKEQLGSMLSSLRSAKLIVKRESHGWVEAELQR